MEFYFVLLLLTVVIAALAMLLWRHTRSPAIVMGIFFLYYWSLYGGWFLIQDLRGGDSGMHYQYLFDKMFPIELNDDYLCSLVYLGLFVIVIELTLLRRLPVPPVPKALSPDRLVHISHSKVLGLCVASGLASYYLMRDSLALASAQDLSAYLVTRGGADYDVISWFTVHATLNRLALFPAAIGLAVLLSGQRVRLIKGHGNPAVIFGYAALLSAMFGYCLILGNKNELFIALLLGVLFYLLNDLRPRIALVVALGCVALPAVALIDYVRGSSLANVSELMKVDSVFDAVSNLSSSNEGFAGHMSMYGCIHYDVPLTYGSSFISLATSIVPRNLWPDRPADIYVHYAESLQAAAGQGYSIHHAAGWYLNFGLAGVLLGGFVFGQTWSGLFLRVQRIHEYQSAAARLFFSFAAISLSAYIPTLIRAGPETYKGISIDAFLVPFSVLWLSQSWRVLPQPALQRRAATIPLSATTAGDMATA